MIDVHDSGSHVGYFEEVWPLLQPAVVQVVEQAKSALSAIEVHAAASKKPGHSFVIIVQISENAASAPQTASIVSVSVGCTLTIPVSEGLSVPDDWERIVCGTTVRSMSMDGSVSATDEGPKLEYIVGKEPDERQVINEWAKASARFLQSESPSIVEALRKESNQP